MKKTIIFALLLIATLASCGGESTTAPATTTVVVDSAKAKDTTVASVKADTVAKATDTVKAKAIKK
jgi:ABC-type glycerol-3-phosphate transport system substrate-binding protein